MDRSIFRGSPAWSLSGLAATARTSPPRHRVRVIGESVSRVNELDDGAESRSAVVVDPGRTAMLTLFTDGGSRGNPGPSAIGGVGFEEGREVFRFSERSPDGTNNEAEYRALLRGLRLAQEYGYSEVECCLDSALVVRQMNGAYRVRHKPLRELMSEIRAAAAGMTCRFLEIPREENTLADWLVNKAFSATPGIGV